MVCDEDETEEKPYRLLLSLILSWNMSALRIVKNIYLALQRKSLMAQFTSACGIQHVCLRTCV